MTNIDAMLIALYGIGFIALCGIAAFVWLFLLTFKPDGVGKKSGAYPR